MSAEQSHGKRFESAIIHQSGFYPLMEGVDVGHTALHDIPSAFTSDGIPVSVKTARYPQAGSPTIYLADAVRFFEATTGSALRILAGFYQPEGARSVFYQVLEVVTDPAYAQDLWGEWTQGDVEEFAQFIKQTKARIGDDPAAIARLQSDAKAYKSQFEGVSGLVMLNPKVAVNVGRLQCSVDAGRLFAWAKDRGLVNIIHDKGYGAIPLPVAFESGARVSRD